MQLIIKRDYLPYGTNGELWVNGEQVCYSIELPWRNNQAGISCIPEGSYALKRRCSEHFGWHLELMEVPGRELILIHPANNAMKELKGCIAPVTDLTGDGEGSQSRAAFAILKSLLFPPLAKEIEVWLKIEESQESITWRRANGLWRNLQPVR